MAVDIYIAMEKKYIIIIHAEILCKLWWYDKTVTITAEKEKINYDAL